MSFRCLHVGVFVDVGAPLQMTISAVKMRSGPMPPASRK